MTIPVEQTNYVYAGPYSTGDILPIPFSFNEPEHVKVMRDETDLEINVDYSVSGQNVILNVPFASGESVVVYRQTTLDNDSEFPQEAKFSSEKIADAIDKLTMQNQEQDEALTRALKFSRNIDADLIDKMSFPASDPGKGIMWASDGTLVNTKDDIDGIITEATAQAVKSATSAAESKVQADKSAESATKAAQTLAEVQTSVDEGIMQISDHTTEEIENKIDPAIAEGVETIQNASTESVDLAKTWAIGEIDIRPEGSAKYWATVAKETAEFDTYTKTELDGKLGEKQDNISAGTGIIKEGSTLSVDSTQFVTTTSFNQFQTLNSAEIATKQIKLTAGNGIQISDDGTIAATGTGEVDAYTKAETDTKLATKQDTLTAGTGISIDNNVITSTVTVDAYTKSETQGLLAVKQNTLTAGNYITISNNVISATPEDMIKTYTESEWNALSDSEKASIKIAYVVE